MTDWLAIIERAAYTRFCKTGSLEPFRLARADLMALMQQVGGWKRTPNPMLDGVVRIQVRVPVPSVGDGVVVHVDEWADKP